MSKNKNANHLAGETSPYLLQHAYNPVEWYPWGDVALKKASEENKPIIVSIGYSACHWCHVMERECFENDELATIMNKSFICIKVDREERPDVDAIYMDAIHAMGVQGGWPLNVFLTADAKPFFGGTYFPPPQWKQILINIAEAYKTQQNEILNSAEGFAGHLNISDGKKYNLQTGNGNYEFTDINNLYNKLEKDFDPKRGGTNRAPKFPMPSIYFFLLRYYYLSKNIKALDHVKLTLDQMAQGGIYDQIGGGFCRYSVDGDWFAPHFEKMLYDNGQLISLYSEAYSITGSDRYKQVVYDTIDWLSREMTNEEGAFYSALDADSEGVEGKFYIWSFSEWQQALEEIDAGFDKDFLTEYWQISQSGNWEHGSNIMHSEQTESSFAKEKQIDETDFKNANASLKKILLTLRAERTRPGLDDKILCSWNGLMLKGLVDAYKAFGEEKFLKAALKNAVFINNKMRKGDQLWHTYKNGKASIAGFLEDYSFIIDAFIALYQVTFDENWANNAVSLSNYAINNFYDEGECSFYFTDINAEKLIARKKEIFDNVIPSSNSAMAKNLYFLGKITGNTIFGEIATNMMDVMKKLIVSEPSYLSNWANLATSFISPTAEVVIIGSDYLKFSSEINKYYYPHKVMMGAQHKSELPLFQNREAKDGKTTIYVCYNNTCKLPVFSAEGAIEILKESQDYLIK